MKGGGELVDLLLDDVGHFQQVHQQPFRAAQQAEDGQGIAEIGQPGQGPVGRGPALGVHEGIASLDPRMGGVEADLEGIPVFETVLDVDGVGGEADRPAKVPGEVHRRAPPAVPVRQRGDVFGDGFDATRQGELIGDLGVEVRLGVRAGPVAVKADALRRGLARRNGRGKQRPADVLPIPPRLDVLHRLAVLFLNHRTNAPVYGLIGWACFRALPSADTPARSAGRSLPEDALMRQAGRRNRAGGVSVRSRPPGPGSPCPQCGPSDTPWRPRPLRRDWNSSPRA